MTVKISRFSLISPSAKYLLLTKALTTIPFAKEAAELIFGENSIQQTQKRLSSISFKLRIIHFESRYRSIDAALKEIGIKNILEFSSGFSFRGLNMCKNPEIYYIDTDLPKIIDKKKIIFQELIKKFPDYTINNLLLRSLNVFDENAFTEIISLFPAGPIAFVNEGLLSYLDEEEKRKLCSIIYNLLKKKGGYWITADIRIKNDMQNALTEDFFDDRGKKFIEIHHVNEKKFENFKVAEDFFKSCGFALFKKIETPRSQLSSIKLLADLPKATLEEIKKLKKVRETWILKSIN